MKIGYARCSTQHQDVELQIKALLALGCEHDRIYTDEGLTGTNRKRPGLEKALAACRAGDEFTVTKLDRGFRSVKDAIEIIQGLAERGVKFALGGSVYDWNDPFGKMFLQILAVVAEFEADLIKLRVREGMARASEAGHLKGKQPKLTSTQQKHLVKTYSDGGHTMAQLAELFGVTRPTIYRTLRRHGVEPVSSA